MNNMRQAGVGESYARNTRFRQLRVLVVDDDPQMLEVVGAMLGSFGYHTMLVSKPAEGLGLALHRSFDCVLLDVQMPGGGGAALARAINLGMPELPIVMMSGLTASEVLERIGGVKVTAILGKPFRLRDLHQAITEAVQWATPSNLPQANARKFGALD